jgi:hypothetical protein
VLFFIKKAGANSIQETCTPKSHLHQISPHPCWFKIKEHKVNIKGKKKLSKKNGASQLVVVGEGCTSQSNKKESKNGGVSGTVTKRATHVSRFVTAYMWHHSVVGRVEDRVDSLEEMPIMSNQRNSPLPFASLRTSVNNAGGKDLESGCQTRRRW